MISAGGIVYPHGGAILSGIALKTGSGEGLGILGENGSGKSLLLEILSTLRRPFAGFLTIMEKDAIRKPDSVRRYIGYVPENNNFQNGFSVEGYLASFAGCYGIKGLENITRREEVISMMGLEPFASAPMERLSLGVLRRVSIARSLVHQPRILIIDNLSMGLDDKWRAHFYEVLMRLKREGITILASMTSLSDIEESRGLWDKVEMLGNGVLRPYT